MRQTHCTWSSLAERKWTASMVRASDSTATPPLPVAGFPVLCSPSNSDSKQYGEDFDGAVKLACLALSVENCKELQKICLQHLLRKKDVLACFPTGYGKSFIFQAWPIVCSDLAGVMFNSSSETCKHSIVLVVCPLVAIMVGTLPSKGIFDRSRELLKGQSVRCLDIIVRKKQTMFVLFNYKRIFT